MFYNCRSPRLRSLRLSILQSPLCPAPLSSDAPDAAMLLRWIAAEGRRRARPSRSLARALSYGRVVDAAARDGELRVFVVAGEVSGDSLASRLMAALRALSPVPVRFAGVGGYVFSLVRLLVQYLALSKI